MALNHYFFAVYSFRVLFGLIAATARVSTTEVPGIGNCPRVNIVQNFDVSRFFGRWYEICAYPNKLTIGGTCVYSTYSWQQNSGIAIYSKQYSLGKEKQYLGSATVVANGVLGVTYPAYPKANAYYNILDTDYENYAVVFSCNNYYSVINGQSLWILSRRKVLESQFIERAIRVVTMNGLNTVFLKHTEQNCIERPSSYS